MLKLQDKMNSIVHKEWRVQGWQFLRAAAIESAEGMEHVGWKWWKKQVMDIDQVRLELVDIWHFILSDKILSLHDYEVVAKDIKDAIDQKNDVIVFDGKEYLLGKLSLLEKFELTMGLSASRRVSIELFASMLVDVEMDWDDLIKMYVGKNLLNEFRQLNGYKTGEYIKIWNGKEDNVVLMEIMESVKVIDGDVILEKLQQEYSKLER